MHKTKDLINKLKHEEFDYLITADTIVINN